MFSRLSDTPFPFVYAPIFLPHRSLRTACRWLLVCQGWLIFPSFLLSGGYAPPSHIPLIPLYFPWENISPQEAVKTKVELATSLKKAPGRCILIFHRTDSMSNLTDAPYIQLPPPPHFHMLDNIDPTQQPLGFPVFRFLHSLHYHRMIPGMIPLRPVIYLPFFYLN